MAASALLKSTVSLRTGSPQLNKQRNIVLWKNLFPAIKHTNLRGKNVFRNNFFGSQSFLYFTKIFVHLSVTAAAR